MNYRYKILAFLIFFVSLSLSAKEATVALQTPDGGRIIVRYDVTVDKDGAATISVLNVQKKLGMEYSNRLDRIRVLFFDKSGGYSEDEFISDIDTEALMIPSNEIAYNRSINGIIWLDEHPELKLKLHTKSSSLSIPVYIAHYEKKHKYKILASCGKLTIPLSTPQHQETATVSPNGRMSRTITTTEEIENASDLSDVEIAEMLIGRIHDLIERSPADRLPEGLDFYVGQLREVEFNIRDVGVKSKIADVLRQVENRKTEVSEFESRLRTQEGADAAARAEEKEARRNMDYLNERLDNLSGLTENDMAEMKTLANEMRRQSHSVSDPQLASDMRSVADRCDEEAKKIDASKKRRNIWLIIGGILLGIVMFVGNQIFQHFRNLRNQRSISEMQENIARQAQSEAKRRARGLAYNQIAKTKNAVRNNVTSSVNKGINNISKGKGNKVTI